MKEAERSEIRVDHDAMSRLRGDLRDFGFAHLENALDGEIMAALRAEASAQQAVARSAEGSEAIAYRSRIAELGDIATTFLRGSTVSDFLHHAFDEAFCLSQHASCFTYYGLGSFLGRHKDRPVECAVTLIIYLEAMGPNPEVGQTGLLLRVFDENGASAAEPKVVIPTRVGTVVVGRGSRFWHERPPLQMGERVVALTACFSAFQGKADALAGSRLPTHEGET